MCRRDPADLAIVVFASLFAGLAACHGERAQGPATESPFGFKPVLVDADGPRDPWSKSAGDLNGDGLQDLLIGGHSSRELLLYTSPKWQKTLIAEGRAYSTANAIADIDGDGRADILSLTADAVVIYKAPDWHEQHIIDLSLHDIEFADIDRDGDPDAVGRNQSAFGGDGATVYLFENVQGELKLVSSREVPPGEGLLIASVGADELPDIIVNQVWLRNNGTMVLDDWENYTYTKSWTWPHSKLASGDIDTDGLIDIVAAPAEQAGETYRIAWFRQPLDIRQPWQEHRIDGPVEAVHHSLHVSDINLDGAPDVVTAEMHQGADPDEVKIYVNKKHGQAWPAFRLGKEGSHNMVVFDFDADGDADIAGANWSGDKQHVDIWENLRCPDSQDGWSRSEIDPDSGSTSLFVLAADLDGDHWKDVIAGSWWYENPRGGSGNWLRRSIADEYFHAAAVADVDKDGDFDIVGTAARGTEANSRILMALNDGNGNFRTEALAEGSGDFLQGIAISPTDGILRAYLSWHDEDSDLQSVPLIDGRASVQTVAGPDVAQHEALSIADLDGDGDEDIVLGTRWLINDQHGFRRSVVHDTDDSPDRNVVVDIDGDDALDIAIGYEAIDKPGKIAWYGRAEGAVWHETVVAEAIGPMSLDAGDVDRDGDIDLVAGEHNLSRPERARLLFLENSAGNGREWQTHVIHTGDEHHNGAQLVDIDEDGDLDVLSIGWSHSRVLLYENRLNDCRK